MKILVVEDSDERVRIFHELLGKDIVVTSSPHTAIYLLSSRKFEMLFLDFDLGRGKLNGETIAKWLEKYPQENLSIIIHSMNILGARRMKKILPGAPHIPFHKLVKNLRRT